MFAVRPFASTRLLHYVFAPFRIEAAALGIVCSQDERACSKEAISRSDDDFTTFLTRVSTVDKDIPLNYLIHDVFITRG